MTYGKEYKTYTLKHSILLQPNNSTWTFSLKTKWQGIYVNFYQEQLESVDLIWNLNQIILELIMFLNPITYFPGYNMVFCFQVFFCIILARPSV